jgi:hypothetical protein
MELISLNKKKWTLMTLACAVMISMAVPAFAADVEKPVNPDKQAKIEQKWSLLHEKAQKFNVDISELSPKDAKAKLQAAALVKLQAKAAELNVDISGISPKDAHAKLQAAVKAKLQIKADKHTAKLQKLQKKLQK